MAKVPTGRPRNLDQIPSRDNRYSASPKRPGRICIPPILLPCEYRRCFLSRRRKECKDDQTLSLGAEVTNYWRSKSATPHFKCVQGKFTLLEEVKYYSYWERKRGFGCCKDGVKNKAERKLHTHVLTAERRLAE